MANGYTNRNNRRKRQRGPGILLTISILMILAAGGWFIAELLSFTQREDRLPANLIVGGVDVGGLQQAEAANRLEEAFSFPLTLFYEGYPIELNPQAISFRPSTAAMLAEAKASGEAGGGFWQRFLNRLLGQEQSRSTNVPLIAAPYPENTLREILIDIAKRYDKPPGKPGFDVQTLTTFPGTEGYELDIDAAVQVVDAGLRDATNQMIVLPVRKVPAPQPDLETLRELIIAYLDSQFFAYDSPTTIASVFVLDLNTGEELNLLGDVAFTAASTTKVSILVDFYRYLTFPPSKEEAWLMANSLLCSNNSSSNLIMQIIGGNDLFRGISSVTQTAQISGAKNSYITAPFVLGIQGQQFGSNPIPQTTPNPIYVTDADIYNQVTAEDLGTLFLQIYDCAQHGSGLIAAFPNGEFNQRECKQMLELMSANDLLRLLQAGIPPDVRISHKNGWFGGTVGDAGIVYPPNGRNYVISIFLWEQTEFQDYLKLWPLVEEISRAAWNYFSPEQALMNRRTDIPVAAQECEGNYLPPGPDQVNLDNIRAWRNP